MKTENQKFCHECGELINVKAEICPKCGVRQPAQTSNNFGPITPGGKSRMIAVIFALLLGGLGIHRFYLGKIFSGILYILFCWTFIPSLIALIEAILMLCMTDQEFAEKYK